MTVILKKIKGTRRAQTTLKWFKVKANVLTCWKYVEAKAFEEKTGGITDSLITEMQKGLCYKLG